MSIDKLNIQHSLIQPNGLSGQQVNQQSAGAVDEVQAVKPKALEQSAIDAYKKADAFSLDEGLEQAAQQAVYYMNSLLYKDGLKAEIEKSAQKMDVRVAQQADDKEVNRYSVEQVIKFYADAKDAKGVIFNEAV